MRHIKIFYQRCIYRTFGLAYRFMENLRLPIFIYFTKDVYGEKTIIFINENQILYFIFSYSLSIFSYIYIYIYRQKNIYGFFFFNQMGEISKPLFLSFVCMYLFLKKGKKKGEIYRQENGFFFFLLKENCMQNLITPEKHVVQVTKKNMPLRNNLRGTDFRGEKGKKELIENLKELIVDI